MSKSYWQSMSVRTERDREALASWFGFMADGKTFYKAEALCDKATDREKKLRVYATDATGRHYEMTRTLGGKNFRITEKRIQPPKDSVGAVGSEAAA